METNSQHNKLIKLVFDGNKHLQKILSNEDVKKMCITEGRFPFTKLPVCGHCENLGLWSEDKIKKIPICICSMCGTITYNPVTYSAYLMTGMDVDKTGKTFREMSSLQKKIDEFNRNTYLPEYNMQLEHKQSKTYLEMKNRSEKLNKKERFKIDVR